MPHLEAHYPKLEAVPETLRDFYVEHAEGGVVLNVKAASGFQLAPVAKLQTALESERKRAKDLEKAVSNFEGLDPEKARSALKTLEELGDIEQLKSLDQKLQQRESQLKGKFEEDRKRLEGQFSKERDALAKQADTYKSLFAQTKIQSEAANALAATKGSAALLMPLISARTRVTFDDNNKPQIEILDGTGNVMRSQASGSTDPMTIKEFVEHLRADPNYSRAFDGSGASGGGASGGNNNGGGGGRFVLTEQQARDPRVYREMAERAKAVGQTVTIAG